MLFKTYFIGSSVATSLIEGEAITKKIAILKIYKNNFKMHPIELNTVRPFVCKELLLKTVDEMTDMDNASLTPAELTRDMVKKTVDEMISKARSLGTIFHNFITF